MTDRLRLLRKGNGIQSTCRRKSLRLEKGRFILCKQWERGKDGSEMIHFLCWFSERRKRLIFIILARK